MEVVSSGADNFAVDIAKILEWPLIEHLPKLVEGSSYYERTKAYYARNKLIALDCSFLVAMPELDKNKKPVGGTANTISYCEELGKKVIIL